MAGIYIHVPFCKQACHYCDFHFSTNTRLKKTMLEAMEKELELRKDYLAHAPIQSIYFGGGTPSLLEAPLLADLFQHISQHFVVQSGAEVTLEANPDDITLEKLKAWKSLGINRLSIGVQSFQAPVLRYLNRAHDSRQAVKSIELAQKAGFNDLSIDLIYAIPQSDDNRWEADLTMALKLAPTHMAAYCLTIEKNTVFGRWQERGKLKAVSDEMAARQFEVLVETMAAHGYEHYEVSNFCLPGHYAVHNSNYWKQSSYLGIGPGAHSYDGVTRQFNVSNNPRYIDSLLQGTVPCTVERLSPQDHINEYIMTSLRTQWGCDLDRLKNEHGYDLEQAQSTYLQRLLNQQLATRKGYRLLLTRQGKLLADQIATDLFVD
ncbi:MAG: radical SAM family heme chaperone HemW [Bacteroidota bacterium]